MFPRVQEAAESPDGRLDLLAAIDRVNDHSQQTSDFDQLSYLKSQVTQHNVEIRTIIQREDPNIQEALERIGRMQQIKRINLDFIEKELFDDKYRVHKMIKLVDLASVFVKKLGLSQSQANSFARFLCEETEEQARSDNKVAYNPNLKINYPMVVVRLQTYSVYPLIYQDSHEQEALAKFKAVLESQRKLHQLCNYFDSQGQQLFKMKDLHNILSQYTKNNSLTDEVVDCVYVVLCRKVAFSDIHLLSNKQLIQSYQGFKAASVRCLLDPCSATSSPVSNIRTATQIQITELKNEELLGTGGSNQEGRSSNLSNQSDPKTPYLGQ